MSIRTMCLSHVIPAIGFLIVQIALPIHSAVAQEDASKCTLTAKTIVRGRLTDTQASSLSDCRQTGPSALATLWLQPDPDARNLDRLAEASSVLRDSRLLTAALAASKDEAAPSPTRIAALRVLASFYSRELWPSTDYLRSGSLGDPIPITMDKNAKDGSSPLPSTFRKEIQQAVLKLTNAGNKQIAHAAAMLRQGFAFLDPSNTPIVANSIILTAGCGPRVTLESRADIGLDLRVTVLGTNYDQHFMVRGRQNDVDGSLKLALPPGTVVVAFGTTEVARLSIRSAPCAPGLTRK